MLSFQIKWSLCFRSQIQMPPSNMGQSGCPDEAAVWEPRLCLEGAAGIELQVIVTMRSVRAPCRPVFQSLKSC